MAGVFLSVGESILFLFLFSFFWDFLFSMAFEAYTIAWVHKLFYEQWRKAWIDVTIFWSDFFLLFALDVFVSFKEG